MSSESAAVNFSELVNKNKQTLARLQESPRLLLHRRGGEDLVLTTAARAEQDQTVVSAATRMLVAMARREPGSMELLSSAPVAQLLIAWQHTAEVYSDPALLAALTRDHGEDYARCQTRGTSHDRGSRRPRRASGTGRPLGSPLR
ncbi:hypothetical protein [Streptomyces sp. ME19-01-6]|uniref:hypothetical protein n=1 Tax=Streptomyces sp. ME19-01-6 TaxID=3028686 RepID=UPI00299FCB10|nr:hypothetical protein [Streptomyces sp. ME19-01-6]MDX3233997.1 hypothetical protein [Streptomyces sp. ME19-01-6]